MNILKKTILINVELIVHMISFLWPKRKKRILCSEWNGLAFRDNVARVYFELAAEDELEFIWIARSDKVKKKASSFGKCVMAYSLKSVFYHLTAYGFIIGSGKSDILRSFITRRSLLINLWHGPPLKNIYLLDINDRLKDKRFIKAMRLIRNAIYPFLDETPDYILSSNEIYTSIMVEAFAPRKGVIEGPLPRWGWGRQSDNEMKPNRERPKKIILYAPTFRDHDHSYLPVSDAELSEVDHMLQGTDTCLLISCHPISQFNLSNKYKNIMLIDDEENINKYRDILPMCTLLISDISSLLHDAVAYSMPAVIYFPDHTMYIAESRNLIPEFSKLLETLTTCSFPFLISQWVQGNRLDNVVNDNSLFLISDKSLVSNQIKHLLR